MLARLVGQVTLGLSVVREYKELQAQPVRLGRVGLVQLVSQVDKVQLGLLV